jgi:esterase/lipase
VKTPLLLLHGALGSRSQLEPLHSLLDQRAIETYAMNFSGHGGAPFAPEFGIEAFAEDGFSESTQP